MAISNGFAKIAFAASEAAFVAGRRVATGPLTQKVGSVAVPHIRRAGTMISREATQSLHQVKTHLKGHIQSRDFLKSIGETLVEKGVGGAAREGFLDVASEGVSHLVVDRMIVRVAQGILKAGARSQNASVRKLATSTEQMLQHKLAKKLLEKTRETVTEVVKEIAKDQLESAFNDIVEQFVNDPSTQEIMNEVANEIYEEDGLEGGLSDEALGDDDFSDDEAGEGVTEEILTARADTSIEVASGEGRLSPDAQKVKLEKVPSSSREEVSLRSPQNKLLSADELPRGLASLSQLITSPAFTRAQFSLESPSISQEARFAFQASLLSSSFLYQLVFAPSQSATGPEAEQDPDAADSEGVESGASSEVDGTQLQDHEVEEDPKARATLSPATAIHYKTALDNPLIKGAFMSQYLMSKILLPQAMGAVSSTFLMSPPPPPVDLLR